MGVSLTPEWLELEKSLGGRTALEGTPEEVKAQYAGMIEMLAPLAPPPTPAVESKDGDVDGVGYRIYTPVEAAKSGPLPVGLFTHSGGFMLGDLDGEDPVCRAVAEHTGSIIISVDYSLTPEHKWPTQLQESLNVFKWARQNASSYGGDTSKFYTIGGSAGGCLAFAVANKIVANPQLKDSVKGVVSIVPCLLHPDNVPAEYKSDYKSFAENGVDVPVLTALSMRQFYDAAGADPTDSSVFVLLEKENLKNFPPSYIVTCGADPLRDDGVIMEKALKAAGVPVKSDNYPDLPHYFWIFPGIPQAQLFVGNLIAGTKWVIDQM
jgi:versiconal hemiacetal acetate esterase